MTAWRVGTGDAWLVLGVLAIVYRDRGVFRPQIVAFGGVLLILVGIASVAAGLRAG